MAGLGAKLFTAFSKLTAAQVNGYLMDQTIMRFANAAARDAAFGGAGEPTLAEGMHCYLDDTNVLQSYTGSAWVSVASSSGSVLQVVYGSTSTPVSNATGTYADTGLTATITPKSNTSKILVMVCVNGGDKSSANVANALQVQVVRGATSLGEITRSAGYTGTSLNLRTATISAQILDSPATTSATTYKAQFRNNSGTAAVDVQINSELSTIVLMEISA